jgi:hypothetical protein
MSKVPESVPLKGTTRALIVDNRRLNIDEEANHLLVSHCSACEIVLDRLI